MNVTSLKIFAGFSILILIAFSINSCGSTDANNGYPIEGTWEQMDDDNPLYLNIKSDNVNQYEFYDGECYIDRSKIINKNGDIYTLERTNGQNEGEENKVEMAVNNDVLTIENGLTFERTDINVSTFSNCNE